MKRIIKYLDRDEDGNIIPGLMVCDCGAELDIYQGDVDCEKCGRSYNSAGQLLAPQSEWGEGTTNEFGQPENASDYWRGYNNPGSAFDE